MEAAEREAVAAEEECATAAARARVAQERAAVPPDLDAPATAEDIPEPRTIQDTMLLHEATAILNLHAQAVAVQNIRSLVPIVLDLKTGNYNCWCEAFILTVGKFSLQGHILTDAAVVVTLTSLAWIASPALGFSVPSPLS